MAGDNPSDNPSTSGFPDFSKLERVQDILDRNRTLLFQIKANHEAQKPDGLAKNFALLREVNGNMEKITQVYSRISDDYVGFMRQQRPDSGSEPGSDDADQPPASAPPV